MRALATRVQDSARLGCWRAAVWQIAAPHKAELVPTRHGVPSRLRPESTAIARGRERERRDELAAAGGGVEGVALASRQPPLLALAEATRRARRRRRVAES